MVLLPDGGWIAGVISMVVGGGRLHGYMCAVGFAHSSEQAGSDTVSCLRGTHYFVGLALVAHSLALITSTTTMQFWMYVFRSLTMQWSYTSKRLITECIQGCIRLKCC